jgi:hypothetical protein
MPNQVTLTFAGEEKPLVDSMGKVGTAADHMGDQVGSASKKVASSSGEASEGFHRAGEAADAVDTKAMGFRDTMTGVQDSMKGTSLIAKGDLFNGFLTLGMGVGDLASGFYNLIIPALGKMKVATLASAAASKVAAAGQWLLNAAQLASPTTWIILAIVALIAVIVLIATKTDWFQKAWRASWGWIKHAASDTWEFLKKIPGWLEGAFKNVARFISAPYRLAFNLIADAWNSTIGRLSWTVPDWIPLIGGNHISVPNLPHFHAGGRVPGGPGQEMLAVLQGGERVTTEAGSVGGGGYVIAGDALIGMILDHIAREVSRRGGRPEHVGLKPL